MTELTEEQLAYLQNHKVSLGSVFDATGLGRKDYSAKMKALGKAVAYGVTPCKKAGHTLRSRSGGCIQCSAVSESKAYNLVFIRKGEGFMAPAEKVNRYYSIVYGDGEQIHLYHRLNTKHMMAVVLWKNTKEYRRSLFWRASTQQSQSAEGGSCTVH